MAKKVIEAKRLAEIEDKFDDATSYHMWMFLEDLLERSIPPEDITEADGLIDCQHKIKDAVYELFEDLGYEFDSDGADF